MISTCWNYCLKTSWFIQEIEIDCHFRDQQKCRNHSKSPWAVEKRNWNNEQIGNSRRLKIHVQIFSTPIKFSPYAFPMFLIQVRHKCQNFLLNSTSHRMFLHLRTHFSITLVRRDWIWQDFLFCKHLRPSCSKFFISASVYW